VPESLKKKLVTRAKNVAAAKKHAKIVHKAKHTERVAQYLRTAKYHHDYASAQRSLIRQRRQAKNNGNLFVEPEAKVAFVIRIKGINAVTPKTRKILQLLRLRQIHNGVFVKLNAATINMLRYVDPYISYGYPNLKSVRDLIYKRGYLKLRHQRVRITSNDLISKRLSHYGITCVEDLVHQIYTMGPHFKHANSILWPFKLTSPLGGLQQKKIHFVEGGDAGNREELINKLIAQML